MRNLNHWVFWPPFLLLLFFVILSIINGPEFVTHAQGLQDFLLSRFDWLLSGATLVFLIVLLGIYFSPIAGVIIGGPEAKPLLSKWKWFSIVLCTSTAIGILFWSTAEPLIHFYEPPENLDISGQTKEASRFAMSTMILHWSFFPYAIYTMAALLFALVFYNLKQPFRVSSILIPIFPNGISRPVRVIIDGICLFSLVAGMSASMGTGILMISGGLHESFGLNQNSLTWGFICVTIVLAFVISAGTGLLKGIRILSDVNLKFLILLASLFFFFGPMRSILQLGLEGIHSFLSDLVPNSLHLGKTPELSWKRQWTIFYWANWMAWAPITALFLGRLGRGYSVRQFISFNLIFPSLFSILWMSIFSGSAIIYDMQNPSLGLYSDISSKGPQSVMYTLLQQYPLAKITGYLFVFIAFLSFTTAADSNTSAMSGLSARGITAENAEAPFSIKILWGLIIGFISWIMISNAGIDGIKTISVIGGFPALLILIGALTALIKLLFQHQNLK